MRFTGFILKLLLLTVAVSAVHGVTMIKEDTKGVILAKSAEGSSRPPEAQAFDQLLQDQIYVNITTADGLLIHIKSERVVKYVFFLKASSFPSQLTPEDLAAVKAKLDELRAFGALAPAAKNMAAPYLKNLQGLYDAESAKYKESVAAASQQAMTDEEKAAFDKKCDLMRLDLLANKDNIKRSEEIVKDMEPLAPHSSQLADVLARWNAQKTHALQLADEGKALWKEASTAHAGSFSVLKQLSEMPDFPEDVKKKGIDLSARLDQFRTSTDFPQLVTYCQAEIPAYFLLNQLPKMVEKIKDKKYEEASVIGQKTMTLMDAHQIVAPYAQIYVTFKNYKDLVDDLRSRFLRQLAKAKQAEDDSTDDELLAEYQKAYDLIPDPKVGAKVEQLKARIKAKQ